MVGSFEKGERWAWCSDDRRCLAEEWVPTVHISERPRSKEENVGDLSEFSLTVRMFLKAYRWRRIDPVPWAELKKPLAESRLALVSSAGFIAPGQEAFDEGKKGGDPSFREIPADIEAGSLVNTHRSESFDHEPVEQDPNIAFPVDRVRELVERGRLGSVNHRHLSFMGSLTAVGRLVQETAPAAVEGLVQDQVDVALLVPV